MKQNGGWYKWEKLVFTVPIAVAIAVVVLFVSAFIMQDYVKGPTVYRWVQRACPVANETAVREVPPFVAYSDVFNALEACEINRVIMAEPGQPAHLFFTNGTQGRVQSPEVFNFLVAQASCPTMQVMMQ